MRFTLGLLSRLVRDENGQDLIEYGLLAATIAVVGVALFPRILTAIGNVFQTSGVQVNVISTPSPPAP